MHANYRWLFGVVTLAVAGGSTAGEAPRPNILFISMDDLNDWVSVLGERSDVKTPNLERLAAMGQVFTNAHCAAPVCNPSRTAVFTGRRPSTSGVYANNQWWHPAMPQVVTLPAYLKAHGYWTEGAGKNFHHTAGFNDPPAWSNYYHWNPGAEKRGWEEGYQKLPDPEPAQPGWPQFHAKNPEFDGAPLDVPEDRMPDRMVVEHAAQFLRTARSQPFFLSVGIFRPHVPYYVPRAYFDLYPLASVELPPRKADDLADIPAAAIKLTTNSKTDMHATIVRDGLWKEAVRAYLASITFADAQLGVLLDALERSPQAQNTIVVLWSDHGFHLGEKDHWAKWTLWRRGTHVPLLVRAPGLTTPGSRSPRPVNLVDLYPTLIELAGLPHPPGLDGTSIVPLLREPNRDWVQPSLTTLGRGNHSLSGDRWHYIRYADGSEELYDLVADPNEWTNVAGRAEFEAVKRDFTRWLPTSDAEPVPAKGAYKFDEETFVWTRQVPAEEKTATKRRDTSK